MQVFGSNGRAFRNRCGSQQIKGRSAIQRTVQPAVNRRKSTVAVKAGFFDFLKPKSSTNPRVSEIVEELKSLAKGTDKGLRSSPQRSEEIEVLLDELAKVGGSTNARSKALWGEYELVYSSSPQALGNVFSAAAKPGQKVEKSLEEPNSVTVYSEYRTLGLLPGYSKQTGQLKFVGGDSYQVQFTEVENKSGLGSPSTQEINVVGNFKVLYLDDGLKVVQYTADDNSTAAILIWQKAGQESSQKTQSFASATPSAPGTSLLSFGGQRPGMATQAERLVQREVQADQEKAQKREAERAKAQQQKEAERAKAQQQKEAEQQAAAAAEAKKRADGEKQAEKEKRQTIKEQLDKIMDEYKTKQQGTREANKELKDIERANSATLRGVSQAQSKVSQAEAKTKSAADRLSAAGEKRKEAESRAKQAQDAVRAAERRLRESVKAAAK